MGITTHILDTALGQPGRDVAVSLARWNAGRWTVLGEGRTDADGRARQLLPEGAEVEAGLYRMRFETAAYYAAQPVTGLYPYVEIAFEVKDGQQHYHIPLLLTANGYTTYRGS